VPGVCIRLKDLVERLFPRRSKQRRKEVEEEERGEAGAAVNALTCLTMASATVLPDVGLCLLFYACTALTAAPLCDRISSSGTCCL
jgi:hypothetical protein